MAQNLQRPLEELFEEINNMVAARYGNDPVAQGLQLNMRLDEPLEPPLNLQHRNAALSGTGQRMRKKRSCWTNSNLYPEQPEKCAFFTSSWKALKRVSPEKHRDYYADYLLENLNSINYPGGEGLPSRWGQY